MNTISTIKSILSKVATVIMIVMLVLAAIPIQSARAATAGFFAPSTYSNSTMPDADNAYASDNVYVQSNSSKSSAIYGNFGFSLPAGSTINLVEVSVEGHGNKNWKVAVSNNNGASYSAFITTITNTNPTLDTTTITRGPGTLWGLTGWTAASLNNSSFKVRITSAGVASSNIAYLDQLKVRVTYSLASNTPTTLVMTAPSAGTYGGTVNLQATLTASSNGAPLSGKTISFILDDFPMGTAVTNASGVATLTGVPLTTGLSGTLLNVGAHNAGASFAGDATYSFSSDADTQVINPFAVTVTANAQSKTYGANDPTLTYGFAPALIGGDTFSGALARAAGENVGTRAINQGTLALSANYTITYIPANLTITPLGITVTADDKAVLAGNPDPAFTFGVSRFVGSDTFVSPPTCGVSGAHTVPGTYPIVCSGGNAGANYSITYINGTLTVTNKDVLTVTANPQTITYGNPDPSFTFTYSGFTGGDDASVINTPPTCGISVAHTNAGTYPSITCTGGSDDKYDFSYSSGTLTVNRLGVTVTANPQNKIYGASDPALTYGFTPALIGGDTFSGALARAAGENVGTYAITQGTLTLGFNYTISYVGANLTINKAPLIVTADDYIIAFGAADPLFTFQYDGFVNGEAASVINTPPTCGVSGAHTALGTYPIVCSGGSDNNYAFAFVDGILIVTDPTGSDTTGVFRPSNGLLYLKNANTSGFADVAINYGTAGDYPVAGDWDGNNTATIGIYRNGSFYLRNSNTLGFADLVFVFGQPGDQPVAGDWNGDGVDTIGVYRPSTGQFLLRDSNSAGAANYSFYLGNVGDVGIAGDWNGDGKDTTGVFRPSNGIIFLKNTNATGFADVALNYGLAGDQPVTGDWNNDGIDTIGVYRNAQFLLRNSNTIGFADIVFALGNPGDMPIAGDWNGIP